MKKSLLIVFGCLICVTLFQAFTTSNDPEYMNLQILPKDISKDDLDSVMHHFSQSLGVKCNFCHVRNEAEKKMNFASDDKPEKKVARKMMLLAIDLNKNYFSHMEMDHGMDKEHMEHMDKDAMKGADKEDMKDMDKDHEQMMKNQMSHDMNMQKMDSMGMNESRYMLMKVNCYTCHRGEEHPNSKLPPRQEGPPPPPQQNPPEKK